MEDLINEEEEMGLLLERPSLSSSSTLPVPSSLSYPYKHSKLIIASVTLVLLSVTCYLSVCHKELLIGISQLNTEGDVNLAIITGQNLFGNTKEASGLNFDAKHFTKCEKLKTDFSIKPGITWADADHATKNQWKKLSCDLYYLETKETKESLEDEGALSIADIADAYKQVQDSEDAETHKPDLERDPIQESFDTDEDASYLCSLESPNEEGKLSACQHTVRLFPTPYFPSTYCI